MSPVTAHGRAGQTVQLSMSVSGKEISTPSNPRRAASDLMLQVAITPVVPRVRFVASIHRQHLAGQLQPNGPLAITTTCTTAGHAHQARRLVLTAYRQIAVEPARQHLGSTGGMLGGIVVKLKPGTPIMQPIHAKRLIPRLTLQSQQHRFTPTAIRADDRLVHTHDATTTVRDRAITAMVIISNLKEE